MIDPERALQRGLIDHLRGDAALKALLGDPARIWDQPPEKPLYPYLVLGRLEARSLEGLAGGLEQALTLTCVSRFGGAEEAKAVTAAVRARLHDADLTLEAHRLVSAAVTYSDVFRGADWRSTYGVVRLRAVTEPLIEEEAA
ncbi:DUF3168 domain-containing protein [Brevundimonas sp. 2R-24]|uniref:DUF3168 domain-containing protein n=1 Tax=Peiella sedimenti TaxID=3061083 RepID=A0ABT8SHS3_9CAUL|nr:DUF3168 domain-containing protein [Caulobacteraceae bacterium XZ-24]